MLRRIGLFNLVGALLLVVSQRGFCADKVQFSGSLVAVTPHSVWVREANAVVRFARLPDKGAISAPSLLGRYKFGDQVLVKSVTIQRFRDDEEGQWFDLEAKSLDYLRPASAAEMASALGSMARRTKGNLLRADPPGDTQLKGNAPASVSLKTLQLPDPNMDAPAEDSPAGMLERSRALTQKYLAALPNFNADQVSKLYSSPVSNPPKWNLIERLESEVSFRGIQEMHRNVVRDGEPWNELWEHLPPRPRAGRQDGLLRNVFDASCTTLEFARRAVEAGVPVLLYRITALPDSCFGGGWGVPGERFYPGETGEVAIAESDNLVRRLAVIDTAYPKGYSTQQGEIRATWDYVKVGEERHLVPVETQNLMGRSDGSVSYSVMAFKNHRHFEAFTNITYK